MGVDRRSVGHNFIRFHQTLRYTPAMEAGIASRPMTVEELVEMAA